MMTVQHIKECLSKAYTKAIAAKAGIMCSVPDLDYGVDGTFGDVEYDPDDRRFSETGFKIDFQLKATVNAKIKDDIILYDLEAKNYNDLVKTNIGTERILILFSLPRNQDEWLNVSEECAIMKKCAWWCSLKGECHTHNKQKVRIRIPKNQILTSEELSRLMALIKEGADL